MLLAEAAPLSGSGGTSGGSTYFRRTSSTGAVRDGGHADADVEAAADAEDAAPPRSDDMSSALGALLLPVYLPRAVLSAGSGLCVVVRRVVCAGAPARPADTPRARSPRTAR